MDVSNCDMGRIYIGYLMHAHREGMCSRMTCLVIK